MSVVRAAAVQHAPVRSQVSWLEEPPAVAAAGFRGTERE
jgi:hypothetical protein